MGRERIDVKRRYRLAAKLARGHAPKYAEDRAAIQQFRYLQDAQAAGEKYAAARALTTDLERQLSTQLPRLSYQEIRELHTRQIVARQIFIRAKRIALTMAQRFEKKAAQ